MRTRQIPYSDLTVTELCLGTMTFGSQVDNQMSIDLLNKATKEYAINFIVSYILILFITRRISLSE